MELELELELEGRLEPPPRPRFARSLPSDAREAAGCGVKLFLAPRRPPAPARYASCVVARLTAGVAGSLRPPPPQMAEDERDAENSRT